MSVSSLRSRSPVARFADALVAGEGGVSALCFVLIVAFYLATAAGNLGETDDVYAFAYRAEHFALTHITDPRLMLYHMVMRLLFLGSQALGLDIGALTLMRGVSALSAAGSLLLILRIASRDLKLGTATALFAAGILASCYGFWRYAAEAEVYLPAIFLVLLIFHGLSQLGGEDRPEGAGKRLGVAAGWGALAGGAVLFYQPSVIPLFFAFPLLLARRDRLLDLCGYFAAGGIVVVAGYLIGFLAYWPGSLTLANFISFLSQRSSEFIVPPLSLRTVAVSLVRAAFALGHDVASANWIFAFDPVTGLIQRAFSYNVITEEIFLAKRAGALAYVPLITLVLLVVLTAGLLVKARRYSLAALRDRRVLALLAWCAINGAIIGRLNPAGIEAWIVLLPPLTLLFAVVVIRPCLAQGAGRWMAGFAAVLFLHNALGGMALVQDPAGEYDRVKGAWVIAEAEPRDLVVVAGNAGLVEALRYLSAAEVVLIAPGDVPELADSLLRDDLSGLLVMTRGRDFNDSLLRSQVRRAGEAGGRVILFDEFFSPPALLQGGRRPDRERLRALREKAVRVYDGAGAGATYVLPAPPG